MARDFDDQLDGLIRSIRRSDRPVHLIGHSNGGSLVLAALPHLSDYVLSAVVQGANASVSKGLRQAMAQFTVQDIKANQQLLNRYNRVHANWESLFEASRSWTLGGPNLTTAELKEIRVPTLVVEGTRDELNVELRHGSDIARHLPNGEFWQPFAGHDVHHDLADEWAHRVDEFISHHDRLAMAEATFATNATASMKAQPDTNDEQSSQLLPGEHVVVIEGSAAWRKVRHLDDGYVGWVEASTLVKSSTDKFERMWHVVDPFIGSATPNGVASYPAGTPVAPTEREDWWKLRTGQTVRISRTHIAAPEADPGLSLDAIGRLLGTPYEWGGRTERGIDCSALSQLSARLRGVSLPRDSWEQYEAIPPLVGDRLPGDLVFFADPGSDSTARVSHVAVHLGDNRIIHAYGPSQQVVSDDLDDLLNRHRGPQLVGWSRPET